VLSSPQLLLNSVLLQIIVASVRPGRGGIYVARWFEEIARRHGAFEVEFVDLAEVALPLLDEAAHPRLQKYTMDHTKAWSAIVSRADAFAFVTPEYDFSTPASLTNAIQYLVSEWAYKPACFVSYGGMAAGTRGVQMTKLLASAVRMMPIPETVAIQFYDQYLDREAGTFEPGERPAKAAAAMLDELLRWAGALKGLRE